MDRSQGIQRRLQSVLNSNRRKMAAKMCLTRYSKVKTLAKASLNKLGAGYNYIANRLATDESLRLILAAVLLVILISWVAMAVTKRLRRRRSQPKRQQQQQKEKEKLAQASTPVKRTATPFKLVIKANRHVQIGIFVAVVVIYVGHRLRKFCR